MNNKKNAGFSLVELIVVIAIMAILVGVLAPAYLKYVEKSRKSSDISSISDMVFAADKVAVDVQFEFSSNDSFILTVASGVVTLSGSSASMDDAVEEWQKIAGSYTCKSKEFKKPGADVVITGTVNDDGSVSYTYDTASPIITYSKDFKAKLDNTQSN